MTPNRRAIRPPDDDDDALVAAAAEEYLAGLRSGSGPSRQDLLARHPDLAPRLAACLEGLEFVHFSASEGAAPAPAGPDLLVAQPLSDFRLVRELGRGGMGVVYEADQLSLRRRVAVKILPAASSLDPRRLQRFLNEAHAAAQLQHANIVPVYGVGSDGGVHYYSMQLVRGQSLEQVIRDVAADDACGPAPGEAPFDAAELSPQGLLASRRSRRTSFHRAVARLGLQAAEALDHAHQLGVVHRDVKPANLLLDARGTLWITDFGLAHFHADDGHTCSGYVLGTLRYMSPEQASGESPVLDQRTDVYSLGATLYELLTLRRALTGQTRHELLQQVLTADPRRPRAIDPTIPSELETILATAMAKEPSARYASAAALAEDLRRFLRLQPILARPPSRREKAIKWARRHSAVTASAAALLLLAAAGSLVTTLIVAGARSRTQEAYVRERNKAAEAERNFRQAREAVDFFAGMASDEANGATLAPDVRARMLEAALDYYQRFIEEHRDDPKTSGQLAESRARVAAIVADLNVMPDLFRVTTRSELLMLPPVRDALGLPADAGDDGTDAFAIGAWTRRLRPDENLAAMDSAGRQRALARVAAEIDADLERVLGPQKARRLREIARRLRGARAFDEPDVAEPLRLTWEQRESIRSIEDRYHVPRVPGPWVVFSAAEQRRRADAVAEIVARLSPRQAQMWKTLTGDPLDDRLAELGPAPPIFRRGGGNRPSPSR